MVLCLGAVDLGFAGLLTKRNPRVGQYFSTGSTSSLTSEYKSISNCRGQWPRSRRWDDLFNYRLPRLKVSFCEPSSAAKLVQPSESVYNWEQSSESYFALAPLTFAFITAQQIVGSKFKMEHLSNKWRVVLYLANCAMNGKLNWAFQDAGTVLGNLIYRFVRGVNRELGE